MKRSKYILSVVNKTGEKNAGYKAENDVSTIAQECGYKLIPLFETNQVGTRVKDIFIGIISALNLRKKLQDGDIVLIQYPVNRILMKYIYHILKLRNVKIDIVTLIHDIDYLRDIPLGRKGVEGMKKLELSLLNCSDYLICHNNYMINKLKTEKLSVNYISLQLFDYLYNGKTAMISEDKNMIIVAGNLLESKAGYLYQINDIQHDFTLSIYGSNFSEQKMKTNKFLYHGSFKPDELIGNLYGSYGLVWDGNSTSTCSGNYGKYLHINNPHKVSLYLAAGIPVIIWKEAALCSFIEENNLGFGIASLDELNDNLKKHEENYRDYYNSVQKIKNKVCTGGFLKTALKELE